MKRLSLIPLLALSLSLHAQTINKPGINIGLLGNYDTVVPDNMACVMNCGLEPPDVRTVGLQYLPGTTTVALYQPYYTSGGQPVLPANHLVGYKYTLNNSTASNNVGCVAGVTASSPYPGVNSSAVTAIAVASNVVTLTVANSYTAGMVVNVTGLAASYLDNVLFTVTAATSSSLALTAPGFSHANVATTSDAGFVQAYLALTLGSIAASGGAPAINMTCPSTGATVLTALPSATQAADKYTLEDYQYPTPSSVWASGMGNISNQLTGGAVLMSDITSPIDGVQSIIVDTTASGSTAAVFPTFDNGDFAGSTSLNRFVSLDGTVQASVMAQAVSGSAAFTLALYRGTTSLCSGSFTATSTAQTFTIPSCTPSENAGDLAPQGSVTLKFIPTGAGQVRIDDFALHITSNKAAANTSNARDAVVAAFQYATGYGDGRTIKAAVTPSTQPAMWSTIRDYGSDERSFAAMAAPEFHASPDVFGTPGNEAAWYSPQLPDFMKLAEQSGAEPYFNVPCAFTDADGVAFIEWLATWVGAGKTFSEAYVTFCNEDWNTGFEGLILDCCRPGAYNGLSDYVDRAAVIFKKMAADPAYNAAYFHFILDQQYGTTSPYTDTNASAPIPLLVASGSQIWGFETAKYTQPVVANFDTEQDEWAAAIAEAEISGLPSGTTWFPSPNAALNAMTVCGPAHNQACQVTTYEWANSTGATCGMDSTPACDSSGHHAYIDNQHLQYIQRGAGQALVTATQALAMMNDNQPATNLYGMFGYAAAPFLATTAGGSLSSSPEYNSGPWGDIIDAGGATSYANRATWGGYINPAPQLIGLHILNKTLIGPNSTITGLPTFNFAGDTANGPIPAATGLHLVDVNCTHDASGNVGIFMANNDQTLAHTVSIPPSCAMVGTVQVEAFSPISLDQMNEASYGTATYNFVDQAVPVFSTLTSPATYTLQPHSIVALNGSSLPAMSITHQTYGGPVKYGTVQPY